jgi:protein-S-isoprenylcysteine O-methyltransferase Ste14
MTDTPHSEPAAPPSALPWPPILLVALIVAAVALGYLLPLPWPGEDDLVAHVAGVVLGLAGIVLIAWAAWTLRRHGTTILPDKAADVLVTDGPFRFRRNPIYIGHVFVLLGIVELTHNIWFALLVIPYIPLVTWLAVLPEERHLEARFGDAWRAYKARTRRWI